MNSKILIAIILFALIIIGFIKKLYHIIKYVEDLNFVNEYALKLNELLSNNINNENYDYILKNATKLANTLGSYGIIDFKPPFANYIHRNYSIVNTILNYNGHFMDDELEMAIKMIHIYIGASDKLIEKLKKQMKNPLLLFAEGFRFIFNIPLYVLNSLGIVSTRIYYKIKGNIIYSIIQNVFVLIGALSSLIGIIQGKEVILEIYNNIFKYITSIF